MRLPLGYLQAETCSEGSAGLAADPCMRFIDFQRIFAGIAWPMEIESKSKRKVNKAKVNMAMFCLEHLQMEMLCL